MGLCSFGIGAYSCKPVRAISFYNLFFVLLLLSSFAGTKNIAVAFKIKIDYDDV